MKEFLKVCLRNAFYIIAAAFSASLLLALFAALVMPETEETTSMMDAAFTVLVIAPLFSLWKAKAALAVYWGITSGFLAAQRLGGFKIWAAGILSIALLGYLYKDNGAALALILAGGVLTICFHKSILRRQGLQGTIAALFPPAFFVGLQVMAAGLAAAGWGMLWQIKSTVALGLAAHNIAIMHGVILAGFALGAWLLRSSRVQPLTLFGCLSFITGLLGLTLNHGLAAQPAGIIAIAGFSAFSIGAALPVLGLIAQQLKKPQEVFYGLMLLGAAGGLVLGITLLIPAFGVARTVLLLAVVQFLVGIAALYMNDMQDEASAKEGSSPTLHAQLLTFVGGFGAFVLGIAWFRQFAVPFVNTTDAFSVLLASGLFALGLAAVAVPLLRRLSPAAGLSLAGIAALLTLPLLGYWADDFTLKTAGGGMALLKKQFILALQVTALPLFLLGLVVPQFLDAQSSLRGWGRLYGLHILAALLGAMIASWVLLPLVGAPNTVMMAGTLLAVAGIVYTGKNYGRIILGLLSIAALTVAILKTGDYGRSQLYAWQKHSPTAKVLQYIDGPAATLTVTEDDNIRALLADGVEAGSGLGWRSGYMVWMGRLPMLLHAAPKQALVIGFTTGRTADALRVEGATAIDVAESNPAALKLAPQFAEGNHDILSDPRVRVIAMDGRTHLRRSAQMYDVITMETLPPAFAGMNNFYSADFYRLARGRLNPGGVMAQVLPYRLVTTRAAIDIAQTFRSVFPNAILWNDPVTGVGILLGSTVDATELGKEWPGFARSYQFRPLSNGDIARGIALTRKGLDAFATRGQIITDDNQLLSYGDNLRAALAGDPFVTDQENKALIKKAEIWN